MKPHEEHNVRTVNRTVFCCLWTDADKPKLNDLNAYKNCLLRGLSVVLKNDFFFGLFEKIRSQNIRKAILWKPQCCCTHMKIVYSILLQRLIRKKLKAWMTNIFLFLLNSHQNCFSLWHEYLPSHFSTSPCQGFFFLECL